MRRRAILALAWLAPVAALAQDNAALNAAAGDCGTAFMKALRKKDLEAALQFVDAPFVMEDAQLLATKDYVKAYLASVIGSIESAELPNQVLGVLDYEQSRGVTNNDALKLRDAVLAKGDLLVGIGHDGLSRGVPLVKAADGKPVVGVGY